VERKKTVFIVVLVSIIIVAGIVILRRATPDKLTAPESLLQTPTSKIDMKTLEISTLPLNDWMTHCAADAFQRYKNPKTGEYTMVSIIVCAKCGKQIPELLAPPEFQQVKAPQRGEAFAKLQRDYTCPYCKKNPFGPPAPR
jgi:DNA-directed RNA polymerase subunit RPC12/RpoP